MRGYALLVLLLPICLPGQDLGSLNTAFDGSVVFHLDKHDRLVMDLFEDKAKYRQDIAYIDQLDPELVHYSVEESALVLECRSENAHCITKEIFKLNVVRTTSRVTLPCPVGDRSCDAAIRSMQDLLRSVTEKREARNETTSSPTRIKSH